VSAGQRRRKYRLAADGRLRRRVRHRYTARPEAINMGLLRLTHERPEITPNVTVREAIKAMSAADIGAIAVKEGNKIVGIFTERDLMKRVVGCDRDPTTTLVRDVMTSNVITVPESASVATAAELVRSRKVRHLVIVDDTGDYVGMLTQRHLLYEIMGELSLKVDDLTGYLMTDGPGG
jgi:CBS domain-containing protein